MANSKQWVERMHQYAYNPTAVMSASLDFVEECLNGSAEVAEPSNPFVQSIEAGALTAAAAMQENLINLRKLYRSLAVTPEDLYLHMSDVDYLDRFATPARAKMQLHLAKEEIIASALPTPINQVRKLTIARHTRFDVNGIPFTMLYPIDIKVMHHGGIQIVYDNSSPSPIKTLTTNQVDWVTGHYNDIEFIRIDIPVEQFQITSFKGTGNLTQNFVKRWKYQDQFYYARAYQKLISGDWVELRTTHTDQVFDPLTPTAVLKLIGDEIQMTVPQVYVSSGQVTGDYRLDVYTTKGPINMDLFNYDSGDFMATYEDLEKQDNGYYIAPMNQFQTYYILSDQAVEGGSNALSFEDLRRRTMMGVQVQDIPITNVSISERLVRRGYDLVTNVDNITNREFLATRALPIPSALFLSTGASATVKTLTASMEELTKYTTVADNGLRLTIKPETLYLLNNGILSIAPQSVVNSINALPLDLKARHVNERQYLYTPFHYVLDSTKNWFETRSYYLDEPKIITKRFVDNNATTGLVVGIQTYAIDRTPTGYRLRILLRSSQEWKDLPDTDVHCQLAFVPDGQVDRAYLNGTLVGTSAEERIYQFDVDTNYDIDDKHNIVLTPFEMYTEGKMPHKCPIQHRFDVFFAVSNYSIFLLTQPSTIDPAMGQQLLPTDSVGVSWETLDVELGRSLPGLWSSARTVISEEQFERYQADVLAVYEDTVFERDPVTGAIKLKLDPVTNTISYVVEHAKGDPILDGQGQQVVRYAKGDIKLDGAGQPILVEPRKLKRHIDFVLIDGVHYFTDEPTALAYRDSIPKTILGWLENDIDDISRYLLEQTRLFLYPKSSVGNVEVIVKENQRTFINAAQSFKVIYYLTPDHYRNASLREGLQMAAISTIAEELTKPTVTMNNIVSKLTASVDQDIIAVDVTGLGADKKLVSVNLVDDSARLTIKKIAVPYADGTIGVQDDVAVTFIQHVE